MEKSNILYSDCGHKFSVHIEIEWHRSCDGCKTTQLATGKTLCDGFSMPWCERCEIDGHKQDDTICLDELAARMRAMEKWRFG